MKNIPTVLLALAAMLGVAGCETSPSYGEVRVHDRDYDVRVVFSDRDRILIRDYYHSYYRGLPPGLAKKGKVPPGHAKKLYRNQPVPPGLEWKHLPDDLERRLGHLPEGYARVIVGTDIGIMNVRTRVIFDLIEDIDD